MTAQDGVRIRRVDPAASAPVLVAARLTAELGAEHRIQLLDSDPDAVLIRVTGRGRGLTGRIDAMLAEARFHGWVRERPPNGEAARADGRSSGVA
ncbi:MAG TPA: hypothetical protein VFV67_01250 [Actinophytocola sp.]|uniref:hypothetical protein n=1 Tax=Actinophytocola sp. TaxID=1872138 RepID=UPI002DB96651|nr:hypothetical protein [Actinophytocola sp.]HEU5469250.1 hypothetical protein [Actinophytocola sp.]